MEKKIRVFYWPARAGYRTHGGRITQIRRDPMKQMCQKKKKRVKGGRTRNGGRGKRIRLGEGVRPEGGGGRGELCSRRKAIKRSRGSNRAGRLSPESLTVSAAHE